MQLLLLVRVPAIGLLHAVRATVARLSGRGTVDFRRGLRRGTSGMCRLLDAALVRLDEIPRRERPIGPAFLHLLPGLLDQLLSSRRW